MASDTPFVSIIIPTYNRADSLRQTLDALTRQTYPAGRLEVIVVDDGSSDDTADVCQEFRTLDLHYTLQNHAGGTQAKNRGAGVSHGDLLVFLDDDISVGPRFVQCLAEGHRECDRAVVTGTLHSVKTNHEHVPEIAASGGSRDNAGCESISIPFFDCLGGFFSIWRSDFVDLGMLQDPAPDYWPNWEDVDFAYRAHLKGYEFRRSLGAVGYHRDHVLEDLETRADRWRRAARAAVLLFHRHPELESQIPMFQDKTPIALGHDSPALIVDKLFHVVTAWRPLQWAMERAAHLVERAAPSSGLLRLLYRWTVSSYIYRGYREGLRDYGPVPTSSQEGAPGDV